MTVQSVEFESSRRYKWIGARTPGAEDHPTSMAAHHRTVGPTQRGNTETSRVRERRTQTDHQPAYAGSRLKLDGCGKVPL